MDREMHRRTGKYRIRTWLRGRLPGPLLWLAPKGNDDCGYHEWYRSEEAVWRCYHCEAGVATESPFSGTEELRNELEAMATRLRHLAHGRPSAGLANDERELADQLASLAARQKALASDGRR